MPGAGYPPNARLIDQYFKSCLCRILEYIVLILEVLQEQMEMSSELKSPEKRCTFNRSWWRWLQSANVPQGSTAVRFLPFEAGTEEISDCWSLGHTALADPSLVFLFTLQISTDLDRSLQISSYSLNFTSFSICSVHSVQPLALRRFFTLWAAKDSKRPTWPVLMVP